VLTGLRRVNAGIGLACGLAMLACCAFILVEIVTRRLAFGLVGGTDEISGYVMAAIASWAGGYALVERAHIRVDILHRKLAAPGRALLDIASLAGLLAVSLALLFHGWGVVAKSIARGSASNTPLETPLWIPQSIWLAGWGWFALASAILLALALAAVARRDWAGVAEIAAPETDETLGPDEGAR
ncbi:MAG: TRAP transporter small permease, partial [Pseudomonadota bacterium]